MDESLSRPPIVFLKDVYDQLLNSGTSLAKIKDAVLASRLLVSHHGAREVVGRSIAWKLFLTPEEPLQPSAKTASLLQSIRSSRQSYVQLLKKYMRAPDGSYEEDFYIPGAITLMRDSQAGPPVNLETNNPLSLHDENPWKAWFEAVELRKVISQDVERTFPEMSYFREPRVQSQLTNILYLYSVTNPVIGYRQGMHEILAPLYLAIEFDSLEQSGETRPEELEMHEICSRAWVAGDAWALFNLVMHGLSKSYEWREPSVELVQKNISSPVSTHSSRNISDAHTKLYSAPIIHTCNQIQSNFLRATDPVLWKQMQSVGTEPQMYGIRWLRLLFTREFAMSDAMKLWDGLFACDPSLELAQWVCVAMLIRIRNELIPADYSGQLTVLLRYPSPQAPPQHEDVPHHAMLLIRQALALQMSPNALTGAAMVIENRNLMNIPTEVTVAPQQKRSFNRMSASQGRLTPPASQGFRQTPSSPIGLPEAIARGLLEKSESLGINKTFMSAVSELRRNIPDIAASLVRTPSGFVSEDERLPDDRPPWEPRTRFEMEREISQLKLSNKRLGQSLNWIVDILEEKDTEHQRPEKERKEALQVLSYIRDILLGNVMEVEETRLTKTKGAFKRRSSETSAGLQKVRSEVVPSQSLSGLQRDQAPRPKSVAGDSALSSDPGRKMIETTQRQPGHVRADVGADPLGVLK